MDKLNLDQKNLKKFGVIMGIALLVIAGLIFRKGHNGSLVVMLAIIFFSTALIVPALLKPIFICWMRLAFILGWLNTRLILIAVFYLILTPIGLGLKLCGKDLLEKQINRKTESYWKKEERKEFKPSDYERQF